jgi:hypothetical protein
MVIKPQGKRTPGILRHACEDNIKMNNKEIVWSFVDWFHLIEGREQC